MTPSSNANITLPTLSLPVSATPNTAAAAAIIDFLSLSSPVSSARALSLSLSLYRGGQAGIAAPDRCRAEFDLPHAGQTGCRILPVVVCVPSNVAVQDFRIVEGCFGG